MLRHCEHTHPYLGPITGVSSGSFSIPMSAHLPEDTFYEIQLTAVDSDGLSGSAARAITPIVAPLALDSLPSGIPVFLDGEAFSTPVTIDGLPGFQHLVSAQPSFVLAGTTYLFACWSDRGAQTHPYLMPESGGALTAIYEQTSGNATVTVAVPAANRNADWYTPVGTAYGNFYNNQQICCGSDGGGQYQLGAEFPLPVPAGSAIVSATLNLRATNDQLGNPVATIWAYDTGSAAAFVAGSQTPLADFEPRTSAAATWAFPAFVAGQVYSSPDLAALVQEVVDRADWSAGNFLGLVLAASTTGEQWRCATNFAAGDPPTLSVTFAVPPGPPANCSPPGDVDGDGDVDLVDLTLLLSSFGLCNGAPTFNPSADFDTSGCVELSDLTALLANFGS